MFLVNMAKKYVCPDLRRGTSVLRLLDSRRSVRYNDASKLFLQKRREKLNSIARLVDEARS
jgi:2-phospho-L-lactate guanylyltransferase (CobY/MobA/RfbA family)